MTAVLPPTRTVRPPATATPGRCSAEDDNCGHVGRLGVLPGARGRGLAKFLLWDQFAADAAAGRGGTMLHVDTDNPTPALDRYLSVGMTATLVPDVWRREVIV